MSDEIRYLKGKWDEKLYGEVPEMRMLRFRFGYHKNTTWVETLFKTDEDRKWFYDKFVPFIYNLAECTRIEIRSNQTPSNDKIGWYLNDMLIGYIVELMVQEGVGFMFTTWEQSRPQYDD